jgi:DNA primase
MPFPPDFLDELRHRLPLAQTIGRRVQLRKRGREFVGLCPFHNEKTPSFTVNEDKGFFHCFGCGAHGDLIGFVMQAEAMGFPEAIERLAADAGLRVPQATPEDRERARAQATLIEVMEAACAWFERQLWLPVGRPGFDYLRGRGLDDATIRRFRLGFAPPGRPGGESLVKAALAREGCDEDVLVEAGLIKRPEDGRAAFDYFRNRVIFPIADRRGRIIAFGGRTLGDGQPKYLNSPDTPLFHKGRTLYGLAQAREAAAKRQEAIVVEGYMDVIALHRAGFEVAVAPLGTAITEAQIEALWRLAPEPVLCFDGDAAGRRAAMRAAERALPLLLPDKSLRFAELPSGEDPDSLLGRRGVPAMQEVLARAEPLVDVIWRAETAGQRFDTPERRAALRRRLYDRARQIAERTVQQQYTTEFQTRFNRAFAPPGGGHRRGPGRPPRLEVLAEGRGSRVRLDPERLTRRILVATAVNHPELLTEVGEDLGRLEFAEDDLDGLRQAIINLAAAQPDLDAAAMKRHLKERGFARLLEDLWQDAWRQCYLRLLLPNLRDERDDAQRAFTMDQTKHNRVRWEAAKQELKAVEDEAALAEAVETDQLG